MDKEYLYTDKEPEKLVQKAALEHYDRMIKWAKDQEQFIEMPSPVKMGDKINEYWYGSYCSYCEYYKYEKELHTCEFCPLFRYEDSYDLYEEELSIFCCNGLWLKLSKSDSWSEWIKNAKEIKEYIKTNGLPK